MKSSKFWIQLFLYSFKNEFSNKLIKDREIKLARKFNPSYRYIVNLISINNKRCETFISDILVCGGKMGITISEVLASLETCFYERSIVKMALRRLTEKIRLVMNFLSESRLLYFRVLSIC